MSQGYQLKNQEIKTTMQGAGSLTSVAINQKSLPYQIERLHGQNQPLRECNGMLNAVLVKLRGQVPEAKSPENAKGDCAGSLLSSFEDGNAAIERQVTMLLELLYELDGLS